MTSTRSLLQLGLNLEPRDGACTASCAVVQSASNPPVLQRRKFHHVQWVLYVKHAEFHATGIRIDPIRSHRFYVTLRFLKVKRIMYPKCLCSEIIQDFYYKIKYAYN